LLKKSRAEALRPRDGVTQVEQCSRCRQRDRRHQLERAGIGVPETLDRLALAAATASLRDRGYIATIRAKVIVER
jgi:hypothetical protein